MKKQLKIMAILTLSALLSASVLMLPSSAEGTNNATVQSYEDQISDLEARQEEARQRIEEAQGSIDSAIEYKRAIDDSIGYTISKINVAENMLTELDAEIAEKEELIKETEGKMKDQREAFLRRVAALEEDGNVSYIELLFGAADITDFLAKYDYVNSMMDYDQRVIDDLKASKKTIEDSISEIEASKKLQEETIAGLEADKTYLLDASAESENALSELQSNKEAWEAEYAKAVAAENELSAELESYLAEVQNQTINISYADGEFIWPLDASTSYISSHFGGRDLNGEYEYHPATDIASATGNPIYASNAGTVLRSEWHDSYGNYVLIDHGGGISTLYAHMSARYVTAGQTVSRGDVIGAVGNTGYSFGSHLHFEYRINGDRNNDPELYVRAPY